MTHIPRSGRVLQLIADANDESARRHHEYIGTEHLVLALSRESADASILPALSVDPQRVYERVDEIIRRGTSTRQHAGERPFTSRTMKVFELAEANARELGHSHVDVAHILVGLMRERVNIGAQALAEAGLDGQRAETYSRSVVAG